MLSHSQNKKIINKVMNRNRPFIDKVVEKLHLPPPPIGKTVGHGFNNTFFSQR
jgi:hypothetical protein